MSCLFFPRLCLELRFRLQSAVLMARMEMEAKLVKHNLFLERPAGAAQFRMLSLFIFISS